MDKTKCRMSGMEKDWEILRTAVLEDPEPSSEMDQTILAYAQARQSVTVSRRLIFRRITAFAALFALCAGITFTMIVPEKNTVKTTVSYNLGTEFDTLNSDISMLSEQLQETSNTMESADALVLAAQNRME